MRLTIINGQLTECKVYGIYRVENDSYELERLELHSEGQIYDAPKDQKLYHSTKNYEDNISHQFNVKGGFCFGGCHHGDYYVKDDELRQFDLYKDVKLFKVDYYYNAKVIEGDAPTDEIYNNRKEYFAYNDYTVNKDDGTIEYHRGYLSKLLFDDKQKEIFNRLKAVIKEARDAKIMFMYDQSSDSLFGINNNHHNGKSYQWFQCCEEGYDEDLFVPRKQRLDDMAVFNYYEDYGINVNELNKEE